MTLLDALRAELGADHVLPQPNWSTATRPGTFAPDALMGHWSAAASSNARPVPSLGIVVNGTGNLPGPLYHGLVGFDGRLRLIHRRLGNHAGAGSTVALNRARDGLMTHGYVPSPDTATLNRRAWGLALDWHPSQGELPQRMHDCFVAAAVGFHRFMGWDHSRVLDHMNATRRKRDNDTVPGLQPAIATALRATPAPIEQDDDMQPFLAQADGTPVFLITSARCIGVPTGEDLAVLQKLYGPTVHRVSIHLLRMAGAQV